MPPSYLPLTAANSLYLSLSLCPMRRRRLPPPRPNKTLLRRGFRRRHKLNHRYKYSFLLPSSPPYTHTGADAREENATFKVNRKDTVRKRCMCLRVYRLSLSHTRTRVFDL